MRKAVNMVFRPTTYFRSCRPPLVADRTPHYEQSQLMCELSNNMSVIEMFVVRFSKY